MLARKLKVTLNGLEVGTTPMLLPAVSSRINLPMSKLLETISAIVDGPILISAYDYYYLKEKTTPVDDIISFPDLIFLDSGGYECNKDQDVSDIGLYKPDPRQWNEQMHLQVIDEWSIKIPTVLISYDHPSLRQTIEGQIEKANKLFEGKNEFLKEILIKPESIGSERIEPDNVLRNLKSLSSFDIIGFTEKELGYSAFKRMINIAKIRKAMDNEDIQIPIHIFGSLDTVTTPLYYLSGADIFDGLSWLRFAFNNGNTIYIDSFGPTFYGADDNTKKMWIRTVYENDSYLRKLKLDLEKFQTTESFDRTLSPNSQFFKKTYEDLIQKIGGDSNGR